MELARISGLESLGGQDIRNAASLYGFTSFEAGIFSSCVNTLAAIYDKPQSPEGIALHSLLKFLESRWKLKEYADKHELACNDIDRSSGDFYYY